MQPTLDHLSSNPFTMTPGICLGDQVLAMKTSGIVCDESRKSSTQLTSIMSPSVEGTFSLAGLTLLNTPFENVVSRCSWSSSCTDSISPHRDTSLTTLPALDFEARSSFESILTLQFTPSTSSATSTSSSNQPASTPTKRKSILKPSGTFERRHYHENDTTRSKLGESPSLDLIDDSHRVRWLDLHSNEPLYTVKRCRKWIRPEIHQFEPTRFRMLVWQTQNLLWSKRKSCSHHIRCGQFRVRSWISRSSKSL